LCYNIPLIHGSRQRRAVNKLDSDALFLFIVFVLKCYIWWLR
jgi:hypothetical protein